MPRLPTSLAACAGLAAGVAACAAATPPPSAPLPSLGRASAFSAPDDRGDLTHVPAAAARATVLELWATSCEPCQRAVPAIAGEAAKLERDGIASVLVGVLAGGESIDRARAALRSWGVERAFLVDRGGGVQQALGVAALPATLVLDRRGVVRWVAPPGATPSSVAAAARWVALAGRP